MLNDSLFLQTKSDLDEWRKSKKSIRARIPLPIKKNIIKLCKQYPNGKIKSAFSLSGCSANFVKKYLNKNPPIQFVELPPTEIKNLKSSSKIEIELPYNITLRIFI
jgi:hypothetical protein